MTYDELKTKINDLPHSRHRAELINAISDASVEAGYETIFGYLEMMIKEHLLRPQTSIQEVEDKTLRAEATRMFESEWARNGFRGMRDRELVERFLSPHGGIRDKTYDDLTEGERRLWQVAYSHYKQWELKGGRA